MALFILYEQLSGRILQVMDIGADEALAYQRPGQASMAVTISPSLYNDYVLDGVVTARPLLSSFDKVVILADGVDTATLAGLPDPCAALINDQEHTVAGGTLELDADYPGTYRVEIRHFPYRDFVQEITAT